MRKSAEGQTPDLPASSEVHGSTATSATLSVSESNADMPNITATDVVSYWFISSQCQGVPLLFIPRLFIAMRGS